MTELKGGFLMSTKVQRVDFPENKRLLVLSDPHGHREEFERLLSRADFSKDDILVIVGDLPERGADSLGLIRKVMSLSETHTVYTLMGNVEHRRLYSLSRENEPEQRDLLNFAFIAHDTWGTSLFEEMLSEIGCPLSRDLDTQTVFPILREHFHKELSFLESRPTILETQNRIFVHGGIPHENLSELCHEDRHKFLKWDHFLSYGLKFQKTLVVGHWPVTLYSDSYPNCTPHYAKEQNILCIDGGCGVKKDGQINLLIFPDYRSETYELLTRDGLPTVTALDAQTESADFDYIHWGDNQVEIIEEDEFTAKVLHHGKTVTVPRSYLFTKDGAAFSYDYTDYRLPVSPGDVLSVIDETEIGLYAKKNGVSGWYTGRFKR